MRSTVWIHLAIFAELTALVVSTDRSLRRLRHQPGSQQSNLNVERHSDSYREEVSDESYLELWDRWLLQDQSMKTNAPVAPVPPTTRQPTKQPVTPPIATPTNVPVSTKVPVAPIPPTTTSPVRPPISPPTTVPVNTKAPTSPSPPTTVPVNTKVPTSPLPTMKPVSLAPIAVPTLAPVIVPSASPSVSPSETPSSAPNTKAPMSQAPIAPRRTLLQFVQSVPELSTLLMALTTSDANRNMPPFLLEVLNNTNTSITIFTPVNAGFVNMAQVVPGYLTQLLTPSFGLHLSEILSYHTTQGIVLSSSFPRTNLQMLAGGRVNITAASMVQSFSTLRAQVLPPPDIRATNGLAQVVNNVLLPQFVFFDLLEGLQFANANSQGQFSTLLRLIAAAGLEATLAEATNVTLIVPVNSGITAVTESFLLLPGNEAILSQVVRYHVLTELFNFAAQKTTNVKLYDTLLQGARVVVGVVPMTNGNVFTRYNQAVQSDYWLAGESILYVVDRILIPPLLRPVIPGVIATNSTPVN